MSELILYGTEGCHLCDLAQKVITKVGLFEHVKLIDIAEGPESEQLINLYGEKIPVLLDTATHDVLCWPFDEMGLLTWLNN